MPPVLARTMMTHELWKMWLTTSLYQVLRSVMKWLIKWKLHKELTCKTHVLHRLVMLSTPTRDLSNSYALMVHPP